MQITISRNVLAEALAELSPLTGKNRAMLVFNNIKFVTKGDRIRLQTSDGATSIRKYVEAEDIDQDGEFLVDCVSLSTFVGKTKGDTLDFIIDGSTLTVKHVNGQAEFQIQSADNFVEPKQDDDVTELRLPAQILASLISIARNFVGDDLLRPQMRPIRAIVAGGTFTVCATDTRKMFVDSVEIGHVSSSAEWYIEPCAFSAIIKACKGQEEVTVKVSESNVSYRIGQTTIFSQQTKGNYPDFKRVIPQNHAVDVVCDKSDISDAVQRVSLFTEQSGLIKITVSALDMNIYADNLDKLQKSFEVIPCTSNQEIIFGANSEIILDCVNACGAHEITLELTAASRPIVFRDTENPNRTVLCMPMNLTNP